MTAAALVLVACSEAVSRGGWTTAARAASPRETAGSPVTTLQQRYVAVVKAVGPSVVQIATTKDLGSGDIFDTNGDIVTNNHVVNGASTVTVTLANGKSYKGKVIGTFPPDDLAVVKISAPSMHPITFADSSKLQVGDIALAIGTPLGLRSSVTQGIVSALRGPISEGHGTNAAITNAIQTSAAINPGNSGGALVDLSGRLIGIPTLAVSDPQLGGAAAGIGFAIPSDTVKHIADQIVKYGKVVSSNRAYLGVDVGDTGGHGVYVGNVIAGSPAAKAGLQVGDVIVAVAGQQTPTTTALTTVLAGLKPGKTVKIEIVDGNGAKKSVSLTLGSFKGP